MYRNDESAGPRIICRAALPHPRLFSAEQRKTSSMPERLLLSSLNCQPPRFKNTALYSDFSIHAPNTLSGSMPRLLYIGSLTSMRSKGRLWDWQAPQDTLRQMQEIRTSMRSKGRNRRIVSAVPARNLSSCPSISSLMKSSRWISGLPNISSSRRLTSAATQEKRWSLESMAIAAFPVSAPWLKSSRRLI
jgi:hypothetical protein